MSSTQAAVVLGASGSVGNALISAANPLSQPSAVRQRALYDPLYPSLEGEKIWTSPPGRSESSSVRRKGAPLVLLRSRARETFPRGSRKPIARVADQGLRSGAGRNRACDFQRPDDL